ncbi:hypothetical protein SO694_0019007 [Aureococcus anophagefferens]|uniref:SGNH hydrolase-type esterase domain-containing protein n=1 Tax=Aureococcus anophagefferens TaxID=44056 RepID=A0ABR1FNZ7_AURAN
MTEIGAFEVGNFAPFSRPGEDLGQVIDHLFSRATTAVYRTTACCGEEDDDWIDGIEAQNAVAKDVMGAAGVPVADVHGFYGWDDLDAATFDGFHANVATCPLWYDLILERIDAARGTNCIGNSDGWDYYDPTRAPTTAYAPTPRPTPDPPAPTAACAAGLARARQRRRRRRDVTSGVVSRRVAREDVGAREARVNYVAVAKGLVGTTGGR